MENIKKAIKEAIKNCKDRSKLLNEIREYLHKEISEVNQPIDLVKWVPIKDVQPNDYNPNSVAKVEMGLLYKSIKHDGYTQPIVTIYDEDIKKYVIVDGFHRYFTCLQNKDNSSNRKG